MTTCGSCGGVIGTDCFNPSECADITQQMQANGSDEVRDLREQVETLRQDNENLHRALDQARYHGPKIASVVERRADGTLVMRAIDSTYVEGAGVVVVIV